MFAKNLKKEIIIRNNTMNSTIVRGLTLLATAFTTNRQMIKHYNLNCPKRCSTLHKQFIIINET